MAATEASHAIILAAGVLCLLATFAGIISARIGTPLLPAGVKSGPTLFNIVFVAVIVSVAAQGWTIAPAARLLQLRADQPSPEMVD